MNDHTPLIEFYDGFGSALPFQSVRSHAVPRRKEEINISSEWWEVTQVTWAIDRAEGAVDTLRACVELRRVK